MERAILCAGYRGADNLAWVVRVAETYPERFAGSLAVDPRQGLAAVRALESVVRDHGFVLARSDYQILEFGRCREQIAEMPLTDETRFDFAYGNAARLFFPKPAPPQAPWALA